MVDMYDLVNIKTIQSQFFYYYSTLQKYNIFVKLFSITTTPKKMV
jgi:hypothetical protein